MLFQTSQSKGDTWETQQHFQSTPYRTPLKCIAMLCLKNAKLYDSQALANSIGVLQHLFPCAYAQRNLHKKSELVTSSTRWQQALCKQFLANWRPLRTLFVEQLNILPSQITFLCLIRISNSATSKGKNHYANCEIPRAKCICKKDEGKIHLQTSTQHSLLRLPTCPTY